jgi:ATP-dependent protease ClpP protease subunit
MWWLLLLINIGLYVQAEKVIKLNTTNNIIIRGEINEKTSSDFIYKLNLQEKKTNILVYLNTQGGSVFDGLKIADEIIKYNISCIAENAYSMGFYIFQNCKNRYIMSSSKLMQHQMSLGIFNEREKIRNYMELIDSVEHEMTKIQVNRLNISTEKFLNNIDNEWWTYGSNIILNNCADEMVHIECSKTLTKQTENVEKGGYKYIYSKCPIVSNYIKKEKLKNNDENMFYFI